jgi:hypothetical protein
MQSNGRAKNPACSACSSTMKIVAVRTLETSQNVADILRCGITGHIVGWVVNNKIGFGSKWLWPKRDLHGETEENHEAPQSGQGRWYCQAPNSEPPVFTSVQYRVGQNKNLWVRVSKVRSLIRASDATCGLMTRCVSTALRRKMAEQHLSTSL